MKTVKDILSWHFTRKLEIDATPPEMEGLVRFSCYEDCQDTAYGVPYSVHECGICKSKEPADKRDDKIWCAVCNATVSKNGLTIFFHYNDEKLMWSQEEGRYVCASQAVEI